MRHGTPNRRSRNNRGHGGGSGRPGGSSGGGGAPNRAQVFDSNGPDVRIRGTAYQIQEKYMALAKDAASSGDQVMAESYLQHAEHYQRVINEWGIHIPRVETAQPMDILDRAHEHVQQPDQPQPHVRPSSPRQNDDLGLPSSILGPKREVPNPEMSDA